MASGYTRPLYLLPFDHRHSYVTGMFKFTPPLTAEEHDTVVDGKLVIYDGFLQAVGANVPPSSAAVLVDEEFGTAILHDAAQRGYVTALSVERSGSPEFEFEYGTAFAEHIEAFSPTFAKVLVRYNPDGDTARNRRQTAKLRQLSDYCRSMEQRLMFELLVPATKAQLALVRDDVQNYDLQVRPELTLQTIRALQDGGVEPDVWKLEGLDRREDCQRVVDMARRDGRNDVGCIVLGRRENEQKVADWLATAASVPGFIGFAVGRTTFWDAIADYAAGRTDRSEAVRRVARRYRDWVTIFERSRAAQTDGSSHETCR